MSTALHHHDLDDHAPSVETPPVDGLGADDLRELMRAVNETAQSLQQTHVTLNQEVSRLKGELAEANAQLRRSRALAALGEMAAGIAHEIRNPLGSIRLYVQMLAEDVAQHADQAELCTKIARATTSLDAIVGDVLLFSREMKVNTTAVSPLSVLRQTLQSCEGLLASGDVKITPRVPEDIGTLPADASLLGQALGNVMRNAIEAMREADSPRRILTIDVGRKRRRASDGSRRLFIVLGVQDTGPGIPEPVLKRMFNPFFTTRHTGTGLGLAIVHRIIDAHGGHVNVTNIQDGGARIELCLPVRPVGSSTDLPDIETLANGTAALATTNGSSRTTALAGITP